MHQLEYYIAAIVRVKVFTATSRQPNVFSVNIYIYREREYMCNTWFHFVAVEILRHISWNSSYITSYTIENIRIKISD